MSINRLDFRPIAQGGDNPTAALVKLDGNDADLDTRVTAAKSVADAAASGLTSKADKTYVDQNKLPVVNPTYTGMMQKTGVLNEFCYRVTNSGTAGGIGGAFADWSGNLTPGLQVDCQSPNSHYMGVRWTHWGVRHLAAVYAYEGGTTSSMVSIGFHFDVGPNKHVFYSNGSAVFAGALTQNSDYRIKGDVVTVDPDTAAAGLRLSRPIEYTDTRDPSGGRLAGFIAHEEQICFPLLVIGEKDAVDETTVWQGDTTPYPPGEEPDGWVPPVAVTVQTPKLQSLNYDRKVVYLTAGWQQHDRRIADLEAKLQAALDRINALEQA